MKVICISCGHSLPLDAAYDDYGGLIKCYVCGALLEIKTSEGKLQALNMPGLLRDPMLGKEHANDHHA